MDKKGKQKSLILGREKVAPLRGVRVCSNKEPIVQPDLASK